MVTSMLSIVVHALEYVDQGVSGVRDRRPALDDLIAAVRRREVSAVVVTRAGPRL